MPLQQRLTGAEVRELVQALNDSFSPPEIERLTFYYTDTQLENVVALEKPFPQILFQLVIWADKKKKLRKLLQGALDENPDHPRLKAAVGETLHAEARAEDLEAIVTKNPRTFDDPELWRDEMQRCEQAICRIENPVNQPLGTGFLVGPDLALTCHHVWEEVKAAGPVSQMQFAFGYRVLPTKKEAAATRYLLDGAEPVAFSPTRDLDFVLLRVQGRPGEAALGTYEQAPKRGWLQPHKHAFQGGETGLILQHPDGMPMKLAFGGIDAPQGNRVPYRIDTLPGSSGAPVFLNDWKPVAIHRQGKDQGNAGVMFGDVLLLVADKLPAGG